MTKISTDQALQISQQLQRQEAQDQKHQGTKANDANSRSILSDDAVTLMMMQAANPIKKVKVEHYKGEIGQERSYINETLKNKLAEYKLNPNTRLSLQKDAFGQIEVQGAVLPTDLEKLNRDLNNNKLFKSAFDKLSKHEPTLNYVDNVVKIAKVYGVENTLFNSLISEQSEFNKLNDIAHRYEVLKNTNFQQAQYAGEEHLPSGFNFVLNA